MIKVVYLVLVFYSNNGLTVEKIPQHNMSQCQVNAKNYGSIEHSGIAGGLVKSKAYCMVGVK